MAFVDDDEEEEVVPQSASKYYFVDNKSPVSFARLPIQWSWNEKFNGNAFVLYLRGISDVGQLPLHRTVKAWRFNLSNFAPEISVLTKENIWIRLEKPMKSFEPLITSILVTLHSLHFLRRKPQSSDKSLWEHLNRKFRSYDAKPSQNDLVDHIDLISEAVKRDVNLAKSEFILAFLAKKPTKKKLPDEDNTKDDFIVGDDDTTVATDEDESDDEDDDIFESVCAFCDNGGELLCCEGSCLRSFHATIKDGEDSLCDSLGFTKREVEAIQKYLCPNCEHKIHQCFICKKLGSSDNSAGAAEVFQCVSATCGYFYHPHCVTRRLRSGNKAESEALERQIIAGEYTCPLHKCSVCQKGEVKTDSKLQFAVCRRCPKSYHRKCLPREISFEDIENEDVITRAWDGLLNNRVLIYCQEHEIDEELLTPIRDHVKFPFTEEKKILMSEKRRILESHVEQDKARPKVKDPALHDTCGKASVKSFRSSVPSSKDGFSTKKHGLVSSVPDNLILRKRKEVDPSKRYRMAPQKSQKMMEPKESCETGKNKVIVNEAREAGKNNLGVKEAHKAGKSKGSLGERFFDQVASKHNKTNSSAFKDPGSEAPTLDNDSQRRLLAIMKKTAEEITMDTMLKKYKVNLTHTNSTRSVVDKMITMGKVEGSVQAARTALKKLQEGGKIEDAKAVCEPEMLSQILKWKEKLKVYLAPFLHGPRYTSFGRHFTNPDKLQQIVDRLHWYAEDGDMIVDFCCGANDFSCLMKVKLEETGKKCLYKNYDLFQAKNNFNFEKRDWMTVSKDELEPGSKLIMGLNPPFGVNASLANKFIRKALQFRPKILILIVPPETERLDKEKSSYVLIWEDKKYLSGNSFYLPGSVNHEDKQLEDWNNVPPPLSLWSRSDFAAKHKKIAEKHYHLSRDVGSSTLKKVEVEANACSHPRGASNGTCDDRSMPRDRPFEYSETVMLENENVPMEIDELEIAEFANNTLRSEKSEAQENVAHVHQPNHLSRRSQLEKEPTKDYSGRKLGKSVNSNNVDSQNNDKEEERGELNRAPGSIKEKNPHWQSPVRSSPDDIYAVCTSISNTKPKRSYESVEASLPPITRTKSNLGKNIREPDNKVKGFGKSEVLQDRPSSLRSSGVDICTVRPSSANTAQKPFDAVEPSYGVGLSHFNDGLSAKYGIGEGYRIPDQFPLVSSMTNGPNEMFDYRENPDFERGFDQREYLPPYGGNLDTMLAPSPPNLVDNALPMQQRYASHFDQMNYQRMSSFPPQPPLQPPVELSPPPEDFRMTPMSFAPGPNPNAGRSGGWIND